MMRILSLIKLVHNENVKIIYQFKTIVMLILLTALVGGCAVFSNTETNHDWRKNAREQIERAESNKEKAIKEIDENREDEKKRKINEVNLSIYEDNLKILNYSIERNIPYGVQTTWKFAYDAQIFIGLIIVFMVIQTANIIANEYSFGTIKQLMIRPFKRWKILLSKYLTIVVISTGFLLFLFAISFGVGYIAFSGNGQGSVELVLNSVGEVVERNVMEYTLTAYLFGLIEIVLLTSLSFMFAVLFKNVTISITSSIVLWLGGSVANNFLAKYSWFRFLLFPHLNLKQYLPGQIPIIEGITITFSIFILFLYFLIFITTALIVFSKRDIY
ncbi:ABC transporter permease [Paenibacillus marchantiophytorum]|uniref:ABC transporter permease n=1 Tax=Paenibacillus marchantiophytorum TaxID=1619310 RepID=A0ABQ1ET13_9BACL|nr:ABC transporter permease [Paenibacillus marchantiophytorum]GFZ85088.1 ABC transporter permease [Paenibacillus marchantiophytorum]